MMTSKVSFQQTPAVYPIRRIFLSGFHNHIFANANLEWFGDTISSHFDKPCYCFINIITASSRDLHEYVREIVIYIPEKFKH